MGFTACEKQTLDFTFSWWFAYINRLWHGAKFVNNCVHSTSLLTRLPPSSLKCRMLVKFWAESRTGPICFMVLIFYCSKNYLGIKGSFKWKVLAMFFLHRQLLFYYWVVGDKNSSLVKAKTYCTCTESSLILSAR